MSACPFRLERGPHSHPSPPVCATPLALQYLAHVLGWEQGAVLPVARPAREAVDSDEQRKLRSMLARDYAVYRLVQQHALEQQDFTASLA